MSGRGARQEARGRDTGRTTAVVVLLLALSGGPAVAGERVAPWSGGAHRVTPLESVLSSVAAGLAGDRAVAECTDPRAWRALGARYAFDPVLTWAMTPLRPDSVGPTGVSESRSRLAPRTCRLVASFAATPAELGTRTCRHEASRNGSESRLGECDGWGSTLVAVHVLAHESMHLLGVADEATADCLAVQLDAAVAARLGAAPSFARRLARDYWTQYYPAQDRRYRSRGCRDGGPLDLFPGEQGWPTPRRYPPDLRSAIASFLELRLRA